MSIQDAKPWRCGSNKCQNAGTSAQIQYYEEPKPKCSFCGFSENMFRVNEIHLVVPDDYHGLFPGSRVAGRMHEKFAFMCTKAQEAFREGNSPKHFTNFPMACTCAACMIAFGVAITNGLAADVPLEIPEGPPAVEVLGPSTVVPEYNKPAESPE